MGGKGCPDSTERRLRGLPESTVIHGGHLASGKRKTWKEPGIGGGPKKGQKRIKGNG